MVTRAAVTATPPIDGRPGPLQARVSFRAGSALPPSMAMWSSTVPGARDRDGALHWAARCGQTECQDRAAAGGAVGCAGGGERHGPVEHERLGEDIAARRQYQTGAVRQMVEAILQAGTIDRRAARREGMLLPDSAGAQNEKQRQCLEEELAPHDITCGGDRLDDDRLGRFLVGPSSDLHPFAGLEVLVTGEEVLDRLAGDLRQVLNRVHVLELRVDLVVGGRR